MRKLTACTLLIIYLNAAAQSLLPWLTDVMAHTFYWHSHLEQVHRGNPHSDHVAREFRQTGKENAPGHTPVSGFLKDLLSAHLIAATATVPQVHSMPECSPFVARRSFYKGSFSEVLHPPPRTA